MFGIDDAVIAAGISGGANLLGGMFSSDQSGKNTQDQIRLAQQQMQFSADQAQINRDYQTNMSNTAYQRASADMQKAGLNPMMMFGSGGAASSPGGAVAATPGAPQIQNQSKFAGIGNAVSNAIGAAVTAKTVDKMQDEIANIRTQRGLLEAETELQKQRTATESHETLRRADEAALTGLSLPAARFSAKSAEDLLSMNDTMRRWGVIGGWAGNKAGDVLAPLLNSASTFRRLMPSRSTNEITDSRTGDQTFHERWDNLWR